MAELPEFPLFEVSDAEMAFGAPRERYLSDKQAGNDVSRRLRAEARAFTSLFFRGGALSDHGFKVRKGLQREAVHRALRALMCSFDCSHEQKEGTVALAIHRWCEPIEVPAERV